MGEEATHEERDPDEDGDPGRRGGFGRRLLYADGGEHLLRGGGQGSMLWDGDPGGRGPGAPAPELRLPLTEEQR
jgi:hypothetical protein